MMEARSQIIEKEVEDSNNCDEANLSTKCSDQDVGPTSDSESNEATDSQWSLADLPDVILVKIMGFLLLKEKYYLSVTCERFYHLFKHPDLWKVADISLFEEKIMKNRNYNRGLMKAIVPKTMSEIVKRFSHLFQHLSLQTSLVIHRFDETFVKLLTDLAQKCRLESLSLEVGYLETKDERMQAMRSYRSNTADVHLLTGLLRSAVRLKHLKIVTWPLYIGDPETDIFQAILSNEKLKSLETLSLFYIDVKKQWTGRIPRLPTPELTTKVISFFPNLTRVSLRSPMMNDELIQMLATGKVKHLEMLQVLIMWSKATSDHDGVAIPDIKDQSWKELKLALPRMIVEVVIHSRIIFDDVSVMLKPEIPMSSVTILKYGFCEPMLIDSISSKYGGSLLSFTSLCDSDSDCDAAVLNLVKSCKKLNRLVYHGDINYNIVMQMSTLLRDNNQEMHVFEFNERNVKTDNSMSEGSNDDDVVIRRDDETKEYFIAGIQSWHYDQDVHRRKLDTMIDHVRDKFGTSWSLPRI